MVDLAPPARTYTGSIRSYRLAGLLLVGGFLATFGLWSATAPLSGAVVAAGHFEVDGNIKRIQHQTGGIVSEILVREGERVAEGQVLARLDQTAAGSNAAIVQAQLEELWMTSARLKAERDGETSFAIPDEFAEVSDSGHVRDLLLSETRLMNASIEARRGQQEQLEQRIAQLGNQVAGLNRQKGAKLHEQGLLQGELVGLHDLLKKGLIPVARVNELDRLNNEFEGDIGQLEASIAEANGKVAETRLQILNLDQQAVAEASRNLQDVKSQLRELTEKGIAAKDVLARTLVRAPISGTVHQLAIHTIGGVVGPGETLMMLVPNSSPLAIEVAVSPQDIESVHLGDTAMVRVTGLDRTKTPDLAGYVSLVGADRIEDPATHASFYPVRLALAEGEVMRLGSAVLIPGMPVETFVQTSQRTFLAYLMQPVLNRVSRAIREK